MDVKYSVIKSNRKTVAIEINSKCEVIVRVPKNLTEKYIASFVLKNEKWIINNLNKCEQRRKNAEKYKIGESEKSQYISLAKEYLPKKTEYWSEITGLKPSSVKITSAEKRYGSCNGKNGICYSYRLMAYPEELIDYVIVHELAHIKHKNHGKQFYEFIEKFIPDYRNRERLLKHKGE